MRLLAGRFEFQSRNLRSNKNAILCIFMQFSLHTVFSAVVSFFLLVCILCYLLTKKLLFNLGVLTLELLVAMFDTFSEIK